MSLVRPLCEGDLPALAGLWLRAFQRPGSPEGVRRYFREVFLEHPLGDEGITSLVIEGPGGAVAGFVGALPRHLRFRGRPILAVVATQLMVESGHGLAAFALLRALFSGPQALTFSDGANDTSQRIWERSGGEVARLYCLDWKRLLRPAGYLAHRLARAASPGVARALRPLCDAVDGAAARLVPGSLAAPEPMLDEEDARDHDVRALMDLDEASAALRPSYDAPSLGWFFSQAARTRGHGALRRRLCRDGAGASVGWYVYYAKPGGVSTVLQLGGRPRTMRSVLRNLLADAHAQGSVALTGQAEPRWLRELSDERAVFVCSSLGVLIHARDREILGAVQRGDSTLSRLDGEWWLRFGSDALVA